MYIYIKQASAFSLILFSKKYNFISEKKYRDKFTVISRQRVRSTVAEEEEMGRGNGRFYQRNTCLTINVVVTPTYRCIHLCTRTGQVHFDFQVLNAALCHILYLLARTVRPRFNLLCYRFWPATITMTPDMMTRVL